LFFLKKEDLLFSKMTASQGFSEKRIMLDVFIAPLIPTLTSEPGE